MSSPSPPPHTPALLLLAAAIVAGCRTVSPAGQARTEAVLTYSGGLSGQAVGVRVWDAGARVRAAAFGGPRLAVADTGVLRAALRGLVALAAAPPDTVAQDTVRADGTRVAWLCGDGISASLTVRDPSGVGSVSDGRCRKSTAEVRFRRAADSIYARLTVPPAR
jgi:hypothetical protein